MRGVQVVAPGFRSYSAREALGSPLVSTNETPKGANWLALLLVRLAEQAAGDTWRNLRFELEKCHLVRFSGPAGDVLQRTESTSRQAAIFKSLAVPEPPRYAELPTPAVTASA